MEHATAEATARNRGRGQEQKKEFCSSAGYAKCFGNKPNWGGAHQTQGQTPNWAASTAERGGLRNPLIPKKGHCYRGYGICHMLASCAIARSA